MYTKQLWGSVWIGEFLEENKQAVYVKVIDDCDKNAHFRSNNLKLNNFEFYLTFYVYVALLDMYEYSFK